MLEPIRAKFDQLALVDEDGWTRNSHHHGFLLRQLPPLVTTLRLANTGRLRRAPEVRAAWRAFGYDDRILSMARRDHFAAAGQAFLTPLEEAHLKRQGAVRQKRTGHGEG